MMRTFGFGLLVVTVSIVVACAGTVAESRFDVEEATIAEMQAAMSDGTTSSEDLVRIYLERIEEIDGVGNPQIPEIDGGPVLNSIIEINPDALSIARERDRERQLGRVRGPLHGIPVVVKDNIDTADRMATSAGSLALDSHRAARDAFIVEKLRDAGAVLLAKANLSEWANFRSTQSSSGWSSRGGQTLNPYLLSRNPCGSSSGSAVAVAANLTAVAIGTETDGSIVCPSSINGIVGLKPTVGLWSRSGIIPISASQDTAGPMTRTVEDAAILLGALAGQDPRDDRTRESVGAVHSDYTQFLDREGLRGKRVGVARQAFGRSDEVDAVLEGAIEAIREAGAEIVDPVEFESWDSLGEGEWLVLQYEFHDGLNRYLAESGLSDLSTLEELIEWNESHAAEVMPWFAQEIFDLSVEKGSLEEAEYIEARDTIRRLSREEGIDAVMEEKNLDVIIAPTRGPAWPIDLVHGDRSVGGYSRLSAVSGYPHITVPAGFVHGLPVGISFFGRAWSEPELLAAAFAYEQATMERRPPRFLRRLEP